MGARPSSAGSGLTHPITVCNKVDGAVAWELSLIDETFQMEEWGEDPDATERRTGLLKDITAAADYLGLCKTDP